MKHAHQGPADMTCVGCYREVEDRLAAQDRRATRILVVVSFLLAIGAAIVLWKLGRMG